MMDLALGARGPPGDNNTGVGCVPAERSGRVLESVDSRTTIDIHCPGDDSCS